MIRLTYSRWNKVIFETLTDSYKHNIIFKCSAPKTWRRFDGKIVELDTQFTIRARELQNIYNCIMLKNVSQDERLDVHLTLKHTVKVH